MRASRGRQRDSCHYTLSVTLSRSLESGTQSPNSPPIQWRQSSISKLSHTSVIPVLPFSCAAAALRTPPRISTYARLTGTPDRPSPLSLSQWLAENPAGTANTRTANTGGASPTVAMETDFAGLGLQEDDSLAPVSTTIATNPTCLDAESELSGGEHMGVYMQYLCVCNVKGVRACRATRPKMRKECSTQTLARNPTHTHTRTPGTRAHTRLHTRTHTRTRLQTHARAQTQTLAAKGAKEEGDGEHVSGVGGFVAASVPLSSEPVLRPKVQRRASMGAGTTSARVHGVCVCLFVCRLVCSIVAPRFAHASMPHMHKCAHTRTHTHTHTHTTLTRTAAREGGEGERRLSDATLDSLACRGVVSTPLPSEETMEEGKRQGIRSPSSPRFVRAANAHATLRKCESSPSPSSPTGSPSLSGMRRCPPPPNPQPPTPNPQPPPPPPPPPTHPSPPPPPPPTHPPTPTHPPPTHVLTHNALHRLASSVYIHAQYTPIPTCTRTCAHSHQNTHTHTHTHTYSLSLAHMLLYAYTTHPQTSGK